LTSRYFEWKRHGQVTSDKFLCRLCAALHDHLYATGTIVKHRNIPDVHAWNAESECKLEPRWSKTTSITHFLSGRQKAFFVVGKDDVS
jgi:hypothetical protein